MPPVHGPVLGTHWAAVLPMWNTPTDIGSVAIQRAVGGSVGAVAAVIGVASAAREAAGSGHGGGQTSGRDLVHQHPQRQRLLLDGQLVERAARVVDAGRITSAHQHQAPVHLQMRGEPRK